MVLHNKCSQLLGERQDLKNKGHTLGDEQFEKNRLHLRRLTKNVKRSEEIITKTGNNNSLSNSNRHTKRTIGPELGGLLNVLA